MLDVIREREFARVAELGDEFGVSDVTVRRDIGELADRGHVTRVRGGALSRPSSAPERSFDETATAFAREKERIGAAAAALVEDGDTVVLDVGTTTTAVARALIARTDLRDVVVFTSALNIALALEKARGRMTVVVTGGTLRPLQHSLVDPLGGTILDHIHATRLFMGCNGVDVLAGVTNVNLPETLMKRRMLGAASQRVVVADGSKVGLVSLAHVCDLADVQLLITDESAEREAVDGLRDAGLDVRVAA